MSTIKGKGIPTRKTKGAIGDIYIDSTTGKQYKCTNAYGVNGEFDYTWRAEKQESVQNGKVEVKPAKPVESKVVPEKKVEEPVKEEVVETAKAPVEAEGVIVAEPEKGEVKEEVPATGKKRTNYAAAYDKKSK